MLTENLKKSELSIAYVHSIAIKCGFEFQGEPRIDNDSVDVVISANGKLSADSVLHSPKLDLQLKATINWEIKEGKISYPLKIKNYTDLIKKCGTPKILVLLCLPKEENEWITHTVEDLKLKKCAHFINLYGSPESKNDTSETIYFDSLNIFDPISLKEMLLKISKEEWY